MRLILLTLLLFNGTACAGIRILNIHFTQVYDKKPIMPEEGYYRLPTGDSIAFDILKYYIGNIGLYHADKLIYKETDSYHLIDHSDESTTTITLKVPDEACTTLVFNLGVDSSTNVSGAMGGDLDPGKGMYWAWQSGYINFKLEGRSSACRTRKNEFAFHLGGYMQPGYAVQTVTLPVSVTEKIDIVIDLAEFIGAINLSEENSVMIPGQNAVKLARKAAQTFKIAQP